MEVGVYEHHDKLHQYIDITHEYLYDRFSDINYFILIIFHQFRPKSYNPTCSDHAQSSHSAWEQSIIKCIRFLSYVCNKKRM